MPSPSPSTSPEGHEAFANLKTWRTPTNTIQIESISARGCCGVFKIGVMLLVAINEVVALFNTLIGMCRAVLYGGFD
ncbi:hypothetical protein DXG03_003675 [Asterophora parasitica]|uniref:Uncharacterized protein n=1 Tax=Asterophora parasitica TaxID=117018 RepID=A0A9P7G976_9AGAR|nr:hypothetical protein DXG03_003675 [Asterophora parasitica]